MLGNTLIASHQGQDGKYDRIPEAGSPAHTEAWALLKTVKRLASAIIHGEDDNPETREVRKSALRLNWRLWTIFQAELTQDRPDLGPEIHQNMLTLCQFVDKHTVGALLKPTVEALSVLIDINRNIALGLLNRPEDDAAETGKAEEPAEEQAAPAIRIETEA